MKQSLRILRKWYSQAFIFRKKTDLCNASCAVVFYGGIIMKRSTLNLVLLALFIALSAVGANIKVMGSIAFDSMPAFLAAMLLRPVAGAIVGAVVICCLRGLRALRSPYRFISRSRSKWPSFVTSRVISQKNAVSNFGVVAIVAFVLNAVLAPVILIFWPGFGMAVALAFFMPLALASAANVLIAVILAYALQKPLRTALK